MKRHVVSLKQYLVQSLRSSQSVNTNDSKLTACQGLKITNNNLASPGDLIALDLSVLGASFPYPQVFALSRFIVVCTETGIYEWTAAGGLVSKLTPLTPGGLWTIADFYTFLVLTNGKVTVLRDSGGVYTNETDAPYGSCVTSYGGQVVFGGYLNRIPYPNYDRVPMVISCEPLRAQGLLSAGVLIQES